MSAASAVRIDDWQVRNNELDQRLVTAMSCKDIDGAMACFLDSPDLVAVLWGKEFRGPDQLRQAFAGLFSQYDDVSLSIDRVREFRSGDAVLAVGQATYTLKKNGRQTKLTEIWTDVRRKVNDRWVYVLDHAEALPE